MSRSNLSQSIPQAAKYANNLVRKLDSDAFFPSFFYPSRSAYITIKALNIELASINESVTNPGVGRIRFQWWRDLIKNAFALKPPSPHPLSHLLSALPLSSLSHYHFIRLVNAREKHFLNPSFNSLQDLADYSSGTQASILYLLLQSISPPTSNLMNPSTLNHAHSLAHALPFQHLGDEHLETLPNHQVKTGGFKPITPILLDHAASHLAVANTIAILLRSIPHHAARRISVIPVEIASRHGMSEERLFQMGPSTPKVLECVSTLVGIAEAELAAARDCFVETPGIPENVMPIFLAATPTRVFLNKLSSAEIGYNVFDGRIQKRQWKLPFQIWSDYRRRRF